MPNTKQAHKDAVHEKPDAHDFTFTNNILINVASEMQNENISIFLINK